MPAKSRMISLASASALALLAGCQSYAPYGQPGYYGQPVYQPPAGSYIAPGGAVPGPALQVAPTGGAFPPYNPQAGTIGGNAPVFDPATDVGTPAGDNLVPEYDDPGDFAPPKTGGSSSNRPGFEDDAGFDDLGKPSGSAPPRRIDDDAFDDGAFQEMSSQRPPYAGESRVELEGIEPLETRMPTTASIVAEDSFAADAGEFEAPIVRMEPAVAAPDRAVRLEETATRTTGPNPYDHDRTRHAWLRGTIDFDHRTGTWNVVYSLRPEADDEFGGSLELLAAPATFGGLQSGDVVLVEGRVDRSSLDALGKPRYRVDRIAPLVPSH